MRDIDGELGVAQVGVHEVGPLEVDARFVSLVKV